MRRVSVLLGLGGLLVGSLQASAQAVPFVSTGARIRVLAPALSEDPIVGRLLVLGGDSLLLATGSADVRMRLPLASVRRVDASDGRQRARWALAGAATGAVAGSLLGSWAGAQAHDPEGFAQLAGFLAGMVAGVPVGAVGGALLAPERWHPVWERSPQ